MNIQSILSHQTCGEACWTAKEDICRCQCSGKNHGCLREKNGKRPDRTSRIDGFMYKLIAVGEIKDLTKEAQKINLKAGYTFLYAHASREKSFKSVPAKMRKANDSQVKRWPELSAWRELSEYLIMPYLLWLKID